MAHTSRRPIALGIAAAFLVALTLTLSANSASTLERFETLLARYDREPAGPAKETLAAEIDGVAHQKYTTVSRLYWYTTLASAEAAAQAQGRPILHLRMLGRLDEDLSCANSRLFRATVYANQEVSRFLREHFVLYWSSERPVPHVTIDYGDGRKLERTTTGNSAHYVLDERGHVLDVLPGLYAPAAFRRELEDSLALATRVRSASDAERESLVAAYHKEHVTAAQRDWDRIAGTPWIARTDQLLTEARVEGALASAQLRTTSKSRIELPDLHVIAKGLAPESLPEDQVEMWSAAGQVLYGIGDLTTVVATHPTPRGEPAAPRAELPPPPRVLDDASRALVVRLHNAVPAELRASGEQLDAVIARLEQTIVADTALNQLRLRPMIGREIVRRGGLIDFATLNDWIYAEVFHTPKADTWLGLLPRDVFTALPGDGVIMTR